MLKAIYNTSTNGQILRRQTATWRTSNNHVVYRINCSVITNLNQIIYVDYKNLLFLHQRLNFNTKANFEKQQIAGTYVNKEEQRQPNQKVKPKQQHYKINEKISSTESCDEVLNLIEYALDKNAGGGLLDHVCFATSVNRLAHHLSRNRMERNKILSDERFSLFFACLAEALVSETIMKGNSKCNNNKILGIRFRARGMANIGWAIAKLGVTVPSTKLPMLQTSMQVADEESKESLLMCESSQVVLSTAQRLRESIAINTANTGGEKHTILSYDSDLTTLASRILDYIGIIVSTNINNAVIAGDTSCTTDLPNLQECSNLHWAWAKAGRAEQIAFELVAVLMIKRVHERLESGSIDSLLPLAMSSSLWAMATANLHPGLPLVEFMESFADVMKNEKGLLKKYNSQALSISAWAIIKFVTAHQSFEKRNELIDNSPSAVHLIKRMQQSALTIINIVAMEVIQRKAIGFNAQDLTNTAWAFARAVATDIVLIRNATHLIIEESIRILPKFNDQDGSNLVWSVAQVFESKSSTIDTLFQRVGTKLLDRTMQVHPQSISMTLGGFVKLNFIDNDLSRSLAIRFFTNTSKQLDPQAISNVMWALATAGITVHHIGLPNKVIPNMVLPSQFTSETSRHDQVSIDSVLYCCAIAANEFIRRPHEFSTQSIANLCWSLATLRVKDATFLKKVEQEVKSRIRSIKRGKPHEMTAFNGQGIANILLSFGTLNYVDCNLVQYFEPYINRSIQTKCSANIFSRHDLANIAWACAVSEKFPDELMTTLYHGQFGSGTLEDIHQLSNIYGDGGLAFQAVRQWAHVQIAMGLAGSKNGLSLPSNFPEGWMQHDGSTTLESSKKGLIVKTSKLQKDVSKSLKSIGFNNVMEHTISMNDLANEYAINVPRNNMNVFSIDIANVEKKIAIEVDGPYHFVHTIDSNSLLKKGKSYSSTDFSMHEPTGSTMLKRRLLTSMGWTVLTVPYWEWVAMKGNQEQEQYCHRLLHLITL